MHRPISKRRRCRPRLDFFRNGFALFFRSLFSFSARQYSLSLSSGGSILPAVRQLAVEGGPCYPWSPLFDAQSVQFAGRLTPGPGSVLPGRTKFGSRRVLVPARTVVIPFPRYPTGKGSTPFRINPSPHSVFTLNFGFRRGYRSLLPVVHLIPSCGPSPPSLSKFRRFLPTFPVTCYFFGWNFSLCRRCSERLQARTNTIRRSLHPFFFQLTPAGAFISVSFTSGFTG